MLNVFLSGIVKHETSLSQVVDGRAAFTLIFPLWISFCGNRSKLLKLFHGTFLHLTVVLVFYAGSSYYVSVSVGPGSGSGSALVHMTSQQQSLPTTG